VCFVFLQAHRADARERVALSPPEEEETGGTGRGETDGRKEAGEERKGRKERERSGGRMAWKVSTETPAVASVAMAGGGERA